MQSVDTEDNFVIHCENIKIDKISMISKLITLLPAVQAALSVLLILTILPQSRGTAVGSAFGGSGTIYRTKRGVEKWLMRATIVIGVIFTAVSLLRIVLGS